MTWKVLSFGDSKEFTIVPANYEEEYGAPGSVGIMFNRKDAALAAAAPELLEAADDAAHLIADLLGDEFGVSKDTEVYDALRAAIKKAKGEGAA